jgi:hypothetical protein
MVYDKSVTFLFYLSCGKISVRGHFIPAPRVTIFRQ